MSTLVRAHLHAWRLPWSRAQARCAATAPLARHVRRRGRSRRRRNPALEATACSPASRRRCPWSGSPSARPSAMRSVRERTTWRPQRCSRWAHTSCLSSDEDESEAAATLARSTALAVLALGLSISIDELAIGFSVGLLRLPLTWAIVLIAAQAFLAAQLGLRLGAHVSERVPRAHAGSRRSRPDRARRRVPRGAGCLVAICPTGAGVR